jgi:hypothetical protein
MEKAFNIKASLAFAPLADESISEYISVTKGESAVLSFDMSDHKSMLVESDLNDVKLAFSFITQITFVIEQPSGDIKKYKFFSDTSNKTIDSSRFSWDSATLCVNCALSPAETAALETAGVDMPTRFQVNINTTVGSSTLIEEQKSIVTKSSIGA